MATITITIPNAKLDNIIDSIADTYNYQEQIINPDTGEMTQNPETKNAFAKRMLKQFVQKTYEAYKAREADSARVTAVEEANAYTEDIAVS